ncbi:hypothetical protein ACDQ55_11980 [Chitinophaga sp. 30R24]|uniref:hypothetical protein n=1 Tax=Chitinophaga sp. 30R24 TaxID=3248838 RepID=UPI003B91D0CC
MYNSRIPTVVCYILLLLMLGNFRLIAQSSDTAKLVAELRKMQLDAKSRPVSYDIRITYTRSGTADDTADTLYGNMNISGARMHYSLNDVETIVNEHYTIVLFKNNKSMYLTQTVLTGEIGFTGDLSVPKIAADMLDWSVSIQGKQKILLVRYQPGAPYNRTTFVADVSSGFLIGIRIIMNVPPQNVDEKEKDAMPTIEIYSHFTNYKPLPAAYRGFDESIYFIRDEGTFKTTPAYRDYQIFKASPNL